MACGLLKVLVYGFYGKNNIGDDFFVEAFNHLFPNINFSFTDNIDENQLNDIDAVFIGGGSFLESKLNISSSAFVLLKQKKIFYIGVGIENKIHQDHLDLLKIAQLILTRSQDQVDNIKLINQNTYFMPDLAYSLQDKVNLSVQKSKSVLILPNSNVLPLENDPHWKHAAWQYFKSEFVQFLDYLIDHGYDLKFFPLCRSDELHDDWIASEIVSRMKHRRHNYIIHNNESNMHDVSNIISKYSAVITQRFHGIILSEMTQTPYMSIYHHDKLKLCYPSQGSFISYYGISKQNLIDVFNNTINIKFNNILPMNQHIFEAFSKRVIGLI